MSNYHYFKNFELSAGISLSVDLYKKQTYLGFAELDAADTLFGLGISHIYNSGSSFSGRFGLGFNLNINETFIKKDDDSFVFTDCYGIKYTEENGKFGSFKYEQSVPLVVEGTNGYNKFVNLEVGSLENETMLPVQWLSNDRVYKGFNRLGQLVLVSDKNGNFYHFEYEVSGHTASAFPKYIKQYKPADRNGTTIYIINCQSAKLVSITDASGNTLLSYEYSYNYLSSVTVRGQTISFNYGANGLSSVTDFNGIKIEISETGLNFTVKSLLGKIPDGTTQSGQTVSTLKFEYDGNDAKITDKNGDYEEYTFQTDRLAYYYLLENGVYKAAEQYTEEVLGGGTDDEQTVKTTTKANPATLFTANQSTIHFQNSEYVKTTYNKQKIAISREERTFAQNLSTFNYNTTEYTYDGGYLATEKTTTKIYNAAGVVAKEYTSYANYEYENSTHYKRLLKSESYVQGENKEITLYEYDINASKYQAIPVKVTNYNNADESLKVISNYDSFGRLTSQTDITGRTTAYSYVNGTQRIYYVTYAGVWAGRYEYDAFGNPVEIAPSDLQHNGVTYASGETVKISSPLNYTLNYTYNDKRRLSSIKYGNISTENYSYSETTTAETATLTNALNETFSIEATKNGLSETFRYNGSVQLINSYNAKGLFIKQEDKVTSGTVNFTYDEIGRILKVSGGGVTEQYEYTADGGINKITYSGNYSQTVTISYTGVKGDRISRIETANLRITPTYDSLGRNTGKSIDRYASNITGETISYTNGLPSKIKYGTKEITYEYDSRGNISKITREGTITTYEHDASNRLKRENNQKLNKTYIYSYDISGNRTAKYEFSYTTASTSSLVNGSSGNRYSYTYTDGKLINYGYHGNISYDACGNPTRYSDAAVTWSKGLMTKFFGSTFEYDGSGRRIRKNNVRYIYDSNGRLLKSNDGFEYFYDHTGVAGFKYQGATYLYRKDIQGNIIAVLNEYGTVQFTYEYDAWGNFTAYDKNGNVLSTSGRTSPTSAEPTKLCDKNPFKYRGYFYDWQTGLYYLQSRYYDPSTGRFISVDSFEYANPETIDGLNLYIYCGNNPVMYIDPTGESIIAVLFGAFLLGAVLNGSLSLITGIVAGKKGLELLAHIVGGVLLGGVLSFSMALGGLFGIGAIATKYAALGLLVATGASYGAGVLSYGLQEVWATPDAKWDQDTAAVLGLVAAVQGFFNFGIGAVLGISGNWSSLNKGQLKSSFATARAAGHSIIKSAIQAPITVLKNNIGQVLVRFYMRSTFATSWSLLRLFN